MKTKYILQISLTLFFLFLFRIDISLCQSKAQIEYPSVTIENTELRTIVSKNIPDQTFQIKIDLPESYSKSDTTLYPVLYLTDADYLFGTATDMAEYLRWGGFMPEVIIVGIAYGTKGKDNMRSRDFRPYPDADSIIGASRFLKFINEELFPLIEKAYRINSDNRTLFGFSAGGRFGTYVLFTKPETFSRYVICSPVVANYNRWGFRLEEQYFHKRKELPAKVYMSIGEIESYYPPFPEFVQIIKSRNYKGLELKSEILANGRHMQIPSEALSRGLKHVYSGESIYELIHDYIKEKNIEFAIAQYKELKQTTPERYNFQEDELNNLGYFLLEMKRFDDAIKIFKLNIEAYPKSANTYDSLADCYITLKDKENARKYVHNTLGVLKKYPEASTAADKEQIKRWAEEKLVKIKNMK